MHESALSQVLSTALTTINIFQTRRARQKKGRFTGELLVRHWCVVVKTNRDLSGLWYTPQHLSCLCNGQQHSQRLRKLSQKDETRANGPQGRRFGFLSKGKKPRHYIRFSGRDCPFLLAHFAPPRGGSACHQLTQDFLAAAAA
jgi:hypothetical protein